MVAEIARDEADAQATIRIAIVGEGAPPQEGVCVATAIGQRIGGVFRMRDVGGVELGEQAIRGDEQLG